MKPITPYARVRLNEIIEKYESLQTPIMMILSDFQKEFGYVPLDVQEIISKRLNIPVAEIYGIVTFYSLFSTEPKGKYVIGVCLGTACYVKGAQELVTRIEEILGVRGGQTTSDGLFTLDILRCVGTCALAPAMVINNEVLPMVRVADVQRIIDTYIRKEALLHDSHA